MVSRTAVDRFGEALHSRRVQLLSEHLDHTPHGLAGSTALPDVLQEHLAVNELIGPAGESFQELEGQGVAQTAGSAAPMDTERHPVENWGPRRSLPGCPAWPPRGAGHGAGLVGEPEIRPVRAAKKNLLKQGGDLSQVSNKLGQTLDVPATLSDGRHGICSSCPIAKEDNHHARKTPHAVNQEGTERAGLVRVGWKCRTARPTKAPIVMHDAPGVIPKYASRIGRWQGVHG